MRSVALVLCLVFGLTGGTTWAQSKTTAAKKTTKTATSKKKATKPKASLENSEDPTLNSKEPPTEGSFGTSGLLEPNAPLKNAPTEAVPSPEKEAEKAPPAEPSSPASTDDHGHLFGVNAALGLPHPVSVGVDYIIPSHLLSFGLSTGSFSMKTEDVEVGINNMEVALRWHPFYGAFYLGALYGQQSLNAKKTEIIQSQSVNAEVEVKSNYLTPHVGWMWGSENGGFFISMDIGYQNPSNVTTTLNTNADPSIQATQEYRDLDADVRKKGNDLGNTALPYWTALKVGWLF